jgi:formate hydrogenlyase subunit 3/multisubunit Na+/H+ antiporter MnhD subunit
LPSALLVAYARAAEPPRLPRRHRRRSGVTLLVVTIATARPLAAALLAVRFGRIGGALWWQAFAVSLVDARLSSLIVAQEGTVIEAGAGLPRFGITLQADGLAWRSCR